MKTIPSNVSKRPFVFALGALLAVATAHNAVSQAATNATTAAAPAPAPTLSPEQRREFAALQQSIMGDAEYAAAVKRAVEAQRAADALFFSKMAKAAKPELQAYIKFLQQARMSEGPASQ